jgi:hypothetical protein
VSFNEICFRRWLFFSAFFIFVTVQHFITIFTEIIVKRNGRAKSDITAKIASKIVASTDPDDQVAGTACHTT